MAICPSHTYFRTNLPTLVSLYFPVFSKILPGCHQLQQLYFPSYRLLLLLPLPLTILPQSHHYLHHLSLLSPYLHWLVSYSFHLLFIFSSSVSNTPLPSLIDFFPLLLLLLPDNSATFEYKTSVSPRLPSSSIFLHSLSHHASLALFVSTLSSLFKLLYICLPTSVFTFLYILLSSSLSSISFVIHAFLVVVLVWYPTTVFTA